MAHKAETNQKKGRKGMLDNYEICNTLGDDNMKYDISYSETEVTEV